MVSAVFKPNSLWSDPNFFFKKANEAAQAEGFSLLDLTDIEGRTKEEKILACNWKLTSNCNFTVTLQQHTIKARRYTYKVTDCVLEHNHELKNSNSSPPRSLSPTLEPGNPLVARPYSTSAPQRRPTVLVSPPQQSRTLDSSSPPRPPRPDDLLSLGSSSQSLSIPAQNNLKRSGTTVSPPGQNFQRSDNNKDRLRVEIQRSNSTPLSGAMLQRTLSRNVRPDRAQHQPSRLAESYSNQGDTVMDRSQTPTTQISSNPPTPNANPISNSSEDLQNLEPEMEELILPERSIHSSPQAITSFFFSSTQSSEPIERPLMKESKVKQLKIDSKLSFPLPNGLKMSKSQLTVDSQPFSAFSSTSTLNQDLPDLKSFLTSLFDSMSSSDISSIMRDFDKAGCNSVIPLMELEDEELKDFLKEDVDEHGRLGKLEIRLIISGIRKLRKLRGGRGTGRSGSESDGTESMVGSVE